VVGVVRNHKRAASCDSCIVVSAVLPVQPTGGLRVVGWAARRRHVWVPDINMLLALEEGQAIWC
jgi:hypothetical protein